MSFLNDLMDGDESFEGLNFIGKDRLANVPRVSTMLRKRTAATYTLIPAQKAAAER